MFRQFIFAVAAMLASMSFAFAQVELNKADQAALDGVKGIGPAKSKAILAERSKGGVFKDWADFESRVKGIGEKNSAKLSEAGLTINGQAKAAPAASASAKAEAVKPAAKVTAPASAAESTSASAAKAGKTK